MQRKLGTAPATPVGQGQAVKSLQASQMAHVAAQRGAISRALSVKSAPAAATPPTGFKAAALSQAGMAGGTVDHVHAAIDSATQAGAFTAGQGAALKAHTGDLSGDAGKGAVSTIAATLIKMRKPQ